jgi:transcriptional regulator with XRE-family HTH domain
LATRISFTGSVANPITDARIQMSISMPALAKRLGLSRQYVSKAEQGTYSSLNPALLRWTSNALSVTVNNVEKRYRMFQKVTRAATIEKVDPAKLVRRPGDDSPGGVIFERWRSGYWTSPTAFSTALCVHPDLIAKYEDGITKSIPKLVKEVLLEHNLIDANWVDDPADAEALNGSVSA